VKKGQLLEKIQNREQNLDQLKTERKSTPRQMTLKDLPKEEWFTQLSTAKKHFIDTIKLCRVPLLRRSPLKLLLLRP